MKRIFFYGLFMDVNLLREKGLHPTLTGGASLSGYRIRIGDRATLVPSSRSTSYGMVIDLPDEEASALYSAPDVRDYVAEAVMVVSRSNGGAVPCLCYNLPPDKLGADANTEYAEKLSALVLRLGFPADYADEILRQRDY